MSNVDPKYLFNDNVRRMEPTNVSFDFKIVMIVTLITGAIVSALVYWIFSNIKKTVPSDFVSSSSTHRTTQQATRGPQARSRPQVRTGQTSDDDSDENSDDARERIANETKNKKKIGTKKLAKLEMKAEKRAAREAMLLEREEKKREQEYADHIRQQEEEKEAELEKQKEEQLRLEKEEQEKKEHEEYLSMAAAFEVQEEGVDQEAEVDESAKLSEFIEYIKEKKVVLLEDLGSHFKMKTKDVISRIKDLLDNNTLTGVIDDRGKFICITNVELTNVVKFIKQRGRVTISELVVNSNKLINLNPDIKVS